jgi:hypothetical protein
MIRATTAFRISSVAEPFDDEPEATWSALRLFFRAESMGLVPEDFDHNLVLNSLLFMNLFEAGAERAGLWTELATRIRAEPSLLTSCLPAAYEALEASPYPPGEWKRTRELLDDDQLAELLRISQTSLRRYASGSRKTPEDTAWRLHSLTRILSALTGAYNRFGIRRWFERPRPQLDGRTPGELFRSAESEDDPELERVVDLAERLLGAGAAT